MTFISFNEYLKTWRGLGLTDQQGAARLLAALRDPANARHVQGFRIEREVIVPTPEEQRRSRRASERKDRIARWLDSAMAWRNQQRLVVLQKWVSTRSQQLSPERWGSFFFAAYRLQRDIDECRERGEPRARLRPISARRRAALERAWRRLKAVAEPEERHTETVTDAPEVVPAYLWTYPDCVDASLESGWSDDDEKPLSGISVDWRAGTLTEWDDERTVEYCNLEVHNALANPTAEEVADRIKKSPISDQNKFWTANASFLEASGIGKGKSFRNLWKEIKYSEKRKPRRGRPPKWIGQRVPAVEL